MEYILMHKNIAVLDMEIDETGYISKILNIYHDKHLPIGIHMFKTGINRKEFNSWWISRSIPASRSGLDDALQSIGILSPILLLEKCYGLSLSDHYWVCKKNSGLEWENINFFMNDFSSDMGEILFGNEPQDKQNINLISPDNTSDGWLQKKWVILNQKRYLMKGGSLPYLQEPFNEVIASTMMERLGVEHVCYTLSIQNNLPYSLCENFITQETELIPAWRILQTQKRRNDMSIYGHFLRCCEQLSIPDIKPDLDKMLTIDYIIANEDRHWNNFGCIRNPDTLEWLGLAPIYDSGTSLWYNHQTVGVRVSSKPFHRKGEEQLKLVSDLSWFDVDVLNHIDEEIVEIFSASHEIEQSRSTAIAHAVMSLARNVKLLKDNLC